MAWLDQLKFNPDGLIPAVIQDATSGQVLMMAFMNRESLEKTLQTGLCTYWSRSRQKLWMKGETSGHVQKVQRILVDCDADCLLIQVEQVGVACHAGYYSCFWREPETPDGELKTIAEREMDPEEIYGG